MEIRFLGTGTSVGVPMIGCACPVCTSADPRDKRRRSCFYVRTEKAALVIDTPPDFRVQMIDAGINRLDAVVFTHAHADHIFGFDDIRRFNAMQNREPIPAYANPETVLRLREIFHYIGTEPNPDGLFRPQIIFKSVEGSFEVGDMQLTPVEVEHGKGVQMSGFIIEGEGRKIGYIPDCHSIPGSSLEKLAGAKLDLMVLDGASMRPLPTHLTVEDSVAWLKKIGAKRSFITHICHHLSHAQLEQLLPEGFYAAYDNLCLYL